MVVVNKTKHQDKDTFISFSSGTLLFGKHKAYRYPEFCFPFLPPPPPPLLQLSARKWSKFASHNSKAISCKNQKSKDTSLKAKCHLKYDQSTLNQSLLNGISLTI